ncbi:hypothetical protein GRZ55_06965 [Chelativorans sp. ZYF759]|uniref:hypothetical protein n=1 Tax=Chelativorans sp. ZYF759 TaxID=2692213 RepID=UPI00145D87C9|nr:hypothetical protein [Chelativorans sp. ZYF759]NMG38978.1 hypothetical protein [Chelativorans sp. ZYF759]
MRVILLSLSSFLFLTTASWACPDWSLSGETHRLSGHDLTGGRSFNVTAGGDTNIARCSSVRPQTDRGQGYVMDQPDFTFDLSAMDGYRLSISVVSQCDSILLINTGRANWYYDDDDNGNLDPLITLTRPSNGWLDVWVGTHDGEYCDARMTMRTARR